MHHFVKLRGSSSLLKKSTLILSGFTIYGAVMTTADARIGDWGDPILIDTLPFVHSANTTAHSSVIDRYNCASQLSESGPEVIYQLQINQEGLLSVTLEGDNAVVDVDLQLLSATTSSARVATACLARSNRALEQSVSVGTYYLVVDSYEGAAQAGPYTLRVSHLPDGGWSRRPIANGVMLETKRYDSLFGGNQYGSVIRVDLNQPGVEVRPVRSTQCQTTSQIAQSAGAVAAINGGYFDGNCSSVSLLKINGQLFNTNARSRSAIGFSPQGIPMIDWIQAGADWSNAHHALGGLSRLTQSGSVQVEWERDSATSDFTYGSNPRTGVGIASNGELIMATLDGRTSAGAGVNLFDFAQWFVWLGALDTLNLDGGGSTTLWTVTEGVVNYPSDNGIADHQGERSVANILAVFAPPLQRQSEWIVRGGTLDLNPGETLNLEVFARDPDGEHLTLNARTTGVGQLNFTDFGDGGATLSYLASRDDPPQIELIVEAFASHGSDGEWRLTIGIIGGQGDPGGIEAGMWMPMGGDTYGGNPNAGDQAGVNGPYAGTIGGTTGGQGMLGGVNASTGGTQMIGGTNMSAGIQAGMMSPIPAGTSGGSQMPRPIPQPVPTGGNADQAGSNFRSPTTEAQANTGASCAQTQEQAHLGFIFLFMLRSLLRQKRLNRIYF